MAQTGEETPGAAAGVSRPTRLVIVQPSMGKYRVPVFRELARRPNISLRVVHGGGLGVPNAPADGFEAVEQPLPRIRLLGQPFYWQKAMLRELAGADVLLTVWDVHYLSLLPALRRARARGVGTILWGHGYSKNESGARRWLRNWMGNQADAVLLYNELGRQKVIEAGLSPSKVFVAPNTIDTSEAAAARREWLSDPARLGKWRREHGLEGPALLHVARYSANRRIDMLLDAAVSLRRRWPDLRIVLIGQGYDQAPVSDQVAQRGLADIVITPGAIYDEQQLAPYFLSARALAFPSHIGLSLHHGFAYGLPVVTHGDRDAQAPELEALIDGENGLLYEKGNLEDLTAKLGRLLEDESLQKRLGGAALEAIGSKWSLSRMVDGMVAAIEHVRSLR